MDVKILERNKNINRGFRKLEIWQLAIRIYQLVHEILEKNSKMHFKVKAQVDDSALAISSNVAEGYSRRSIKENLRFNEIALSSAAENYSQMFALVSTLQISKENFDTYDILLYEWENKTISMNKRLIGKLTNDSQWNSDYELR